MVVKMIRADLETKQFEQTGKLKIRNYLVINNTIKLSMIFAVIFSVSSYAKPIKIECERSQKVPDVEVNKKERLWSLDFDNATSEVDDKKTFVIESGSITWTDPWGSEYTYFIDDNVPRVKGYRIMQAYSKNESNIERGISYFEEKKCYEKAIIIKVRTSLSGVQDVKYLIQK